jgi:hypothetical protein
LGGRFINASGAWRCEDANACLELEQRHCEERSDEAIHTYFVAVDCFAALAMTSPQLLSSLFEN